jgi:hypothetical protein
MMAHGETHMQLRLLRLCSITAAIAALLVAGMFDSSALAQKQKALLWYKAAVIDRVTKPNRKPVGVVKAKQRAALLTLQWHLIKRGEGNKNNIEVNTVKPFQTGDQVKIAITANQDGYLYIINQSQGKDGVVIFPDPRINNGMNKVKANQQYLVPQTCEGVEGLLDPKDCWLEMSAPAGREETDETFQEDFTVIFSRDEITSLPNQVSKTGGVVAKEILEELRSGTRQRIEQGIAVGRIPGRPAARFATRVQNTNPKDNEELIATIELKHRN